MDSTSTALEHIQTLRSLNTDLLRAEQELAEIPVFKESDSLSLVMANIASETGLTFDIVSKVVSAYFRKSGDSLMSQHRGAPEQRNALTRYITATNFLIGRTQERLAQLS